jgi:hypothetical protein
VHSSKIFMQEKEKELTANQIDEESYHNSRLS